LDGVARLYAFTSVREGTNASLIITAGVPTTLAYAEPQHLLLLNLTVLGVVALGIWVAAWVYASRYILRPVSTIAATTKEVGAGNLAARTGIPGDSGELNQLGQAFDAMAASLQHQRAETEQSHEALRQSEQRVRELNSELEDRVRKRTAQLEQAYSELEAFSYSVSHDLRAPLRPINGYVELLQHEEGVVLTHEAQRLLNAISGAANRMGILIDNLLAFSRMGRVELRRECVSMAELVLQGLEELKPEMEGRDFAWHIAALPEVVGDRAMLQQVWTNLLSNAVKYTRPRERAEVEVGFRDLEHEVEFHVRDNGAGFDMRYVHKLFGVFQRLHHAREFEGTGIGLANVQRIVIRHGGRAWAEGKVGQGAVFFFTLPKMTIEQSSSSADRVSMTVPTC
jgi:light-regulated signal transduction histidine kinase (bacteriophytochrome)